MNELATNWEVPFLSERIFEANRMRNVLSGDLFSAHTSNRFPDSLTEVVNRILEVQPPEDSLRQSIHRQSPVCRLKIEEDANFRFLSTRPIGESTAKLSARPAGDFGNCKDVQSLDSTKDYRDRRIKPNGYLSNGILLEQWAIYDRSFGDLLTDQYEGYFVGVDWIPLTDQQQL